MLRRLDGRGIDAALSEKLAIGRYGGDYLVKKLQGALAGVNVSMASQEFVERSA